MNAEKRHISKIEFVPIKTSKIGIRKQSNKIIFVAIVELEIMSKKRLHKSSFFI